MKSRVFNILILFVAVVFMIPMAVFADDEEIDLDSDYCTQRRIRELTESLLNVRISYKPVKKDDNKYEFIVSIINMPNTVYAEMKEMGIPFENSTSMSKFDLPITFPGNDSYKISFYALSDDACADELIYEKSFLLPKYNVYSELDECIEYEEFPLCNMYYKGDIKNLKDFKNQLNEFINSMKAESPPVDDGEKSVFAKIADFYTKNLIFTIPGTIIIVGIIVFVIIKVFVLNKKKKRIGIDEFIGE